MKKTLLFALAIACSLTIAMAKKKAPKQPEKAAVELKSGSDSISYAAGYANTQGLISFLQQQYKVDTAYMADFIQGFTEAQAKVNDPKYVAYLAGGSIAQMVEQRMITGMGNDLKDSPDSLVRDLFYRGFADALAGDTTKFTLADASKFFGTRLEADQKAKMEKLYGDNRKAGEAFLEANKSKFGVKTTASGLQYKVLTEAFGPKPAATQKVKVKYEGRLVDGTVFDSSYSRNDSIVELPLSNVIPGWREGIAMMPVGSKWELYIPYNLAYGERDMGKIKPFSALIFKVELVGIHGVDYPAKPKDTVPAVELTPAKPAKTSAKAAKTSAKASKATAKKK